MAQKLDINPWTAIWTRPRETIQKIVNFNPKYCFIFLSAVYGFNMLLQLMQTFSFGMTFSLGGMLIGALILSPFIGMAVLSAAALLIKWTGGWIGGKGSYMAVRAALSWSNVPNIVHILLWLLLAAVFKRALFTAAFGQMPLAGGMLYFATTVLLTQMALSIWAFLIAVKTVAQVQGFSAWKGLFNLLIPFFMLGIAVWLFSTIVQAFR